MALELLLSHVTGSAPQSIVLSRNPSKVLSQTRSCKFAQRSQRLCLDVSPISFWKWMTASGREIYWCSWNYFNACRSIGQPDSQKFLAVLCHRYIYINLEWTYRKYIEIYIYIYIYTDAWWNKQIQYQRIMVMLAGLPKLVTNSSHNALIIAYLSQNRSFDSYLNM